MRKARPVLIVLLLTLFAAACGTPDSSGGARDARGTNGSNDANAAPSEGSSAERGRTPSAGSGTPAEPPTGPSGERTLPETVRLAYEETTATGTAKVAFEGTGTGLPGPGEEPLSMFLSGRGVVDNRSGDARLTTRMPPVGEMETRVVGDAMYMRFSGNFTGRPPGGKPWMKVDLEKVSREQFGASLSEMGGASAAPEEQLGYLRGVSDSVERLGEEEVRGVPTTHYRATVDLEKAAAGEKNAALRGAYEKMTEGLGAPEFPMEVWLDGKDRVRRVKTVTPVPEEPAADGASGGGEAASRGEMTMVYEYYDFGAPARVVAPPADQTTDVTGTAIRQRPGAS